MRKVFQAVFPWVFLLCSGPVEAGRFGGDDMSEHFYNIYRPQNRSQIYRSYRALVERRDGISELEARLIAQYEAVGRDMDTGYHLGKPRVADETAGQWTVRFPSKFSLTTHSLPPDLVMFVGKKDGNVRWAQGGDT